MKLTEEILNRLIMEALEETRLTPRMLPVVRPSDKFYGEDLANIQSVLNISSPDQLFDLLRNSITGKFAHTPYAFQKFTTVVVGKALEKLYGQTDAAREKATIQKIKNKIVAFKRILPRIYKVAAIKRFDEIIPLLDVLEKFKNITTPMPIPPKNASKNQANSRLQTWSNKYNSYLRDLHTFFKNHGDNNFKVFPSAVQKLLNAAKKDFATTFTRNNNYRKAQAIPSADGWSFTKTKQMVNRMNKIIELFQQTADVSGKEVDKAIATQRKQEVSAMTGRDFYSKDFMWVVVPSPDPEKKPSGYAKYGLMNVLKPYSYADLQTELAAILSDEDKGKLFEESISLPSLDPEEFFSLADLSADSQPLKPADIYRTQAYYPVFKNFGVSNDIADKIIDVISDKMKASLSGQGVTDDAVTKLLNFGPGTLAEDVDQNKLFNIDDIAKLFAGTPEQISQKFKEIGSPDQLAIKKAIKELYKSMIGHDYDQYGDKPELYKRAALASIKTIDDAFEYYQSGRKVRTKAGPATGITLGTGEASGIARKSQQLVSVFDTLGKDDSGNSLTIEKRFENFERFLDRINDGKLSNLGGSVNKKFSHFVSVEILNEMFFRTAEPDKMGNWFEAFLAMLAGGTQTGAAHGAEDFVFKQGAQTIKGSSKLQNAPKFHQARSNLLGNEAESTGQLYLYILALKGRKTKSGMRQYVAKDQRLTSVDIHLIYVQRINNNETGEEEYFAWAYSDGSTPPDVKKVKSTDNSVKFDPTPIMDRTYLLTLDFSFLREKELLDVSEDLMNQINADLSKAFKSLVDLRDNISLWVSEKDPIAANQVSYNYNDLGEAIKGMKKADIDAAPAADSKFPVKENKNNLDNILDKLIKEVILNK